MDELTKSQKEIIQNLLSGKEIFYPPDDNPDIEDLIKKGWLLDMGYGQYEVLKELDAPES